MGRPTFPPYDFDSCLLTCLGKVGVGCSNFQSLAVAESVEDCRERRIGYYVVDQKGPLDSKRTIGLKKGF